MGLNLSDLMLCRLTRLNHTMLQFFFPLWCRCMTGCGNWRHGASCKDAVVLLQRISVYIHSKLENVGHGSWLVLAMWLFCYQGAFFTLTKCGHKLKLTIFRFLQDSMPDLHSHFQYNDIQTHMYASQWFLTLFTAKFPLPMVYRIMDLFLCYVSHDSVNSLQ